MGCACGKPHPVPTSQVTSTPAQEPKKATNVDQAEDNMPADGKKTAKILVLFYSMYTHNLQMAKAVAAGIKSTGVEVDIMRIPETLPDEVLEKMGALDAKKAMAEIPAIEGPDVLTNYDGFAFGIPTRFGNMPAQWKAFLDQTGGLWAKGSLFGKTATIFASSNTQHGGQETTIISSLIPLMHHGLVYVPPGYGHKTASAFPEVSGGTPYGATTIGGADGSRMPSEAELDHAKFIGGHLAKITAKLVA
eukprot:Clim_evm53s172 gene=Clim_evmTU53s172